ncbi:MAG: Crp/Fnr family transcriptional regulator [Bacteroidota bacterium]
MTDQCFWYLENVDLKMMMSPQKMMEAQEKLLHRHFKKGENIYLPQDLADKVYFVQTGRVKIGNYSDQGKEITKTILGEGEIFGELGLIGTEKHRDFAVALEDVTLCIMTVEEMKAMMKQYSGLSLFFMKMMGARVLEMEQRLESMVFKDSRTRIIEYLLYLVEKKGQRVGYEMLVRRFLTHQEIANLTATSRQTVTTVLNDLRSRNIITFNRRRLLVRDLEQLTNEINKTV